MTRTPTPTSDGPPSDRAVLRTVRRLVVKVGTRVLTGEAGELDQNRLESLCRQLAEVHHRGVEVLLVSSGAVGIGARRLGFETPPTSLEDRQACAAVGQARLMHLYEGALGALGVLTGQVLLIDSDFDDRDRYLNLRSTLSTLIHRRVIPVINENDAVSVSELAFSESERVFGDNDHLSSLVAIKLDADLLILLTDVDGVFDRNPDAPGARLISVLEGDEALADDDSASLRSKGAWSRGGMRSKIESANAAARSGCHAVVAAGHEDRVLERILDGEDLGSWFPARGRVGGRRRWIGFAARSQGELVLDRGAVAALRRGASLLASGISSIEGDFERGDVVDLLTEDGRRVGRGMIYCNRAAADRWRAGERPKEARNHHALVHRDHLVLEEWISKAEEGSE